MSSKAKTTIFIIINSLILVASYITDIQILSNDVLANMGSIGWILALALVIYNFIHDDLDLKTLIFILLFGILIFITSNTSRNYDFLYVFIMMLAFKDVDLDKLLLSDAIVRTIVVIIEVSMFLNNNGWVAFDTKFDLPRYALGFYHPNTLGLMLMLIPVDIMYVCRDKKLLFRILSYIFSGFMFWVILKVTISRTSAIVLAFAVLLFIIFNFKMDFLNIKPIKILTSLSFFIFFVLSYALIFYYASAGTYAERLNSLFSGRLYLTNYYTNIFGITPFGQRVLQGQNSVFNKGSVMYFTIDMSYVWVLLTFGVVFTIFLGILYFFTSKRLIEEKKYHAVVLVLVSLLYGMTEQSAVKYTLNYLIVLISYGIYYFNTKDSKKVYLSAPVKAGISVLAICLFTFLPTIAENTSFFVLNNNMQQYNFLLAYWQKFHDLSFSLYDWSLGLGASIFNIVKTGILNPINLLILPFPKAMIEYVYLYLNIIKLCLLGVFSALWLSFISKDKTHIILTSILIVFSGLVINNFEGTFFEVCTLLPFVLYTIELYLNKQKKIPFIISLFIILISGINYEAIILLIVVLYILLRGIELNKTKAAVKLLAMLVLTIGLSCVVLIPSLYVSETTIEGFNNDFLSSLLSLLIPFNNIETSNFGYLSIFALSVLPLLFINNSKKEAITLSVYLLINIILTLVLKGILGSASIYLLTISYIYIFIKLIDSYKQENYKVWLISMIVIALFAYMMYLICGKDYYSLSEIETLYIVSLIVITILDIFLFRKYGVKALSFLIIFDISLAFTISVNNMEIVDYYDYSYNYVDVLSDIKNDDSLYRVVNTNFANRNTDRTTDAYSLNNANQDLINNLAGVSTNSAIYDSDMEEYINLISGADSANCIGFDKNNIAFYNVAGVKYYYNSYIKSHRSESGALILTTPEETKDAGTLAINNAELISDDNYLIRNNDSSLVLTAHEDLSVSLEEYDGSDLQTWHITHDDGSLVIYNIKTKKALDLNENTLYQNDNIVEADSQKWVAIDRDNKYEIISLLNADLCISSNINNIYVDNYIKDNSQYWQIISTNEINNSSLPIYYEKVEGKDYYVNKYFIELGYVNNNTINQNAISDYSYLDKERIMREYVLLENSDNTSFTLHDDLTSLVDYIYISPFEYVFETPISNVTLCIYNNASAIVNVKLYNGDTLLKEEDFYQYNYCNVQVDENMSVTKVVIEHTDPANLGYSISLYSIKKQEILEEELYQQRIQNAFTNIRNSNTKITADINITQDNSLVYTYIPYDDNWAVKVDGQEVEKLKANYGFTAFYLNAGNHSVEFKYNIEGFNTGLIISGVSLVGLILYVMIDNKKKIKKLK